MGRAGRLRFETVRPEPGRCWIGNRPRRWPGPAGLWTDVARGRLGSERGNAEAPGRVGLDGLEDTVYLPPVAPDLEPWRRSLAERLVASGTPVLYQVLPGAGAAPDGVAAILDLLPVLAAGETAPPEGPRAGTAAVWPLVAGLCDGEADRGRMLRALAEAEVPVVQPLRLELEPADRRRLAEGLDEEAYGRFFHGPVPSARELARAVHDVGLEPFLPRPEATAWPRPAQRRAAAELALAGELWLELGRGEAQGQALLRAARWMDRERHDLRVLAEQGRLEQVAWLDGWVARVVGECLLAGRSTFLEEVRREYLEG